MTKLLVTDIAKRFGPKQVLNGVSFSLEPGQSLVVIGGSGTGKSVLIKCILGLMRPDRGQIAFDGVELTRLSGRRLSEQRARMGMLFQGGALFDSLTVWENVTFGLIQSGRLARAKARPVAEETLALVGLDPDVAGLMPAELSGGMQKRVGLARAIASRPELLFFDEPTTGLDPIMSDVINDLIVGLVKRLGATAITITHDMASARKIADRVAMLYQGRLIWEGPPSALDQPGEPHVEQFVHGRAEGPIRMPVRAL